MILEWLVSIASGFVGFIAGLLPGGDVIPEEVRHPGEAMDGLSSVLGGMAPWVDFGFVTMVVGLTVALYAVGLTVKLIRALIAHLPQFGGNG